MERFAGRYILLRRLGSGAMGDVHLARDLATGRECALKRIAQGSPAITPELMRREFEALSRVRHPAIVAVHDLGFAPNGAPFITMEFVPGLPSERAIAAGDWAALFHVAARTAAGLERLHAANVLHGDLKPSNLLVQPGLEPGSLPLSVRLVDFGLAGILGRDTEGKRGTPGYVAPEVARGEAPSVAADLYGLGATIYRLVAGRSAFTEATVQEQQSSPPPVRPLEDAGCPAALRQLVLRLMATNPAERYATARDVREDLERMHAAARRPLEERLDAEVLIGRAAELGRLGRAFGANARRRRVFVITGDPGSGKSVLLREAAARASLEEHRVIRCALAPDPAPGGAAAVIARTIAAEAGVEPAAPPELAAPGGAALVEALAEAGAKQCERLATTQDPARMRRIVLVIDDAQHLDAASRGFLRRMVLHDARAPMTWLLARRGPSEEAEADEQMLEHAGYLETLALPDLSREESDLLVASRVADVPPEALAAAAFSAAAGHPGRTVEFLRAAVRAKALGERDGAIAVDPQALDRVALPATFEASLLDRLRELGRPAAGVAEALAVLGRPALREELDALSPDATEAARATLCAAGLARAAGGRWSLRPPTLATPLLETAAPERIQALRERALQRLDLEPLERFGHLAALERTDEALAAAKQAFGAAANAALAIRAARLALPTRPAEAAEWFARGARAERENGRYAQAVEGFERARSLDPDPARRGTRAVELATALAIAERHEEAERCAGEALAYTKGAERAELMMVQSGVYLRRGESEEAVRLAARVAEDPDASAEVLGRALINLSAAHMYAGRLEEARTIAQRATRHLARSGLEELRLRAIGNEAVALYLGRDIEAAGQRLDEAIAAARAGSVRHPLLELLTQRAGGYVREGRLRAARTLFEEASRLALEYARPARAANAAVNLAIIEALIGRPRAALHLARRGLRLDRSPQGRTGALRAMAQAHRMMGRPARAARAARAALASAFQGAMPDNRTWAQIELARSLVARGRRREALTLAREATKHPQGNDPAAASLLLALLGSLALREHDVETVTNVQQQIEARDLTNAPYGAAHAMAFDAQRLLAAGESTAGAVRAREALEAFDALPAPHDRATAVLDFARMIPPRQAEPHVSKWLEQAAAAFARTGDRAGREAALEQLLERARQGGGREPHAANGRGLVERLGWLLQSLQSPRELAQRAMQMAVDQMDAERGLLLLEDAESGALGAIAEYGALDAGARREAMRFSRRIVERVTKSGVSMVSRDAQTDPSLHSESVIDMNLRSIVCVPMLVGGRAIGAIYLDDSRRPEAFGSEERSLLEGVAQMMAIAIERSRGHADIVRTNEKLVGENLALRQEVGARFQSAHVIGSSSEMRRVMSQVEQAAQVDTTILIGGETGTGKGLIARTLHHMSRRGKRPFVEVNCGAISENLLESELFGILPKVATDVHGRDGKFMVADGGTLFLDEVAEMRLHHQVALLSVLANREITPVGGQRPIPVDVRVIAGSHKNLRQEVEQGRFREDLFYRLSVIDIEIPPLRDRKADIPMLAHHFVVDFAKQQQRPAPEMSPEFMAALMQSDWPGNVRELENYIERQVAMSEAGPLRPDPPPGDRLARSGQVRLKGRGNLPALVEELERKLIAEALDRAEHNQSRAARALGLTEQSLRYRMKKYGLESVREKQRDRENRRRSR